jgi:D-alanyl-D-alanine carboxypeptidase
MDFLKSLFAAFAAGFSWATGRNATKNAAPIVAAKTAQDAANADAKTDEVIKNKDLDELRKEASE